MVTLSADSALEAVLGKLNEPAEIRDAAGKLLGYSTPAGQDDALLYLRAAAHFDPAEMKKRKESGQKGYTTREVLEHLQSLEAGPCGSP